MNLDKQIRDRVTAAVKLLERVPDGIWTEVSNNGLAFQAATQEKVREVRALFPGVLWKKEYYVHGQWWSYRGFVGIVPIEIYAVREQPPTCRAVEEEVEVVEEVPIAFEKRTVKRKQLRWDCSGAPEGDHVDD